MQYHKVLILGTKGMLGQALVEEFEKQNYEVIALNHADLDVTDELAVKNKICEISPDLVINTTAVNLMDEIEKDNQVFETAKKVNGNAVGYLINVADSLNIPFVHFSTNYVFGGSNTEGYREDHAARTISRYGETKLLGEEKLLRKAKKYYLIRISRLFGKAGVSEKSKISFVDLMLDLVLNKKKEHLDVVEDEVCSPTYAPDAARLTRELIEGNYPWGIYHGANEGGCSWYEFAQEIFKLRNVNVGVTPVKSDFFLRPAKRPKYSVLLNTKLPKQRGWEEALGEYLDQNPFSS